MHVSGASGHRRTIHAVLDYPKPLLRQAPGHVAVDKKAARRYVSVGEQEVRPQVLLTGKKFRRAMLREADVAQGGRGFLTQRKPAGFDHLTVVCADRQILVECDYQACPRQDAPHEGDCLYSEPDHVVKMDNIRIDAF